MNAELKLGLYRTMSRIRAFELAAEALFLKGKLPGFIHLSIGQEAVAAGVIAHLHDEDVIASTHRGHGHALAKGATSNLMMAELFGRITGACRGKGGSMHIFDFSKGMLGANGVVGASMPIATGAGLAFSLLGASRVAVAFFGDGAANRGTFHESANLAATWKLPVIFVCENNRYASTTPAGSVHSIDRIAKRAAGYGMPGITVEDGNDVIAVHAAAGPLLERARRGEGPALLECMTYRLKGHFVGDPEQYRTKEEVKAAWADEPLAVFRGRYSPEPFPAVMLDEIDREAEAEMRAAAEAAEAAPLPDPETALEDVFTEPVTEYGGLA